jgi:hypothetical protein
MTIIVLLACSKGVVDLTYNNEVFRGITYTDSLGNIVGPVDSSDWQISDMPINYAYRVSSGIAGEGWPYPIKCYNGPAYPNPTAHSVDIHFYLPIANHFRAVIINENQQVVARFKKDWLLWGFSIYWHLNDLNDRRVPPGMYRMIYQLSNAENCDSGYTYSGYGDIWVIDKNTIVPMK